MEKFEEKLGGNPYKIWNRLTSGSYFPPAVRRVEINKIGGGKRPLGIPTVGDRISQMVIKDIIEARLEKIFQANSYAYRKNKRSLEAVRKVREGTVKYPWLLDIDIKNFFDSIDHNLLMKALDRHVEEKWIKKYIKRWLEAPIETEAGLETKQGKGSSQGGVISPLLANLYLHYSLDVWLKREYPEVELVRYADDSILHCKTEEKAKEVLSSLKNRLTECKLELHPEKTKVVYTKSWKHKGGYPIVKFDFLGFTFQPRPKQDKKGKGMYLGYDGAISKKSRKRIMSELRSKRILKNTEKNLEEISKILNPKLRGWINYYSKLSKHKLQETFRKIDYGLVRWVLKKYKRLKGGIKQGYKMLRSMKRSNPTILEHWRQGLTSL